MQIRKGETAYQCSKIRTKTVGNAKHIRFTILEKVTPHNVAELFEDDAFYFYDDVLNGRMIETNNMRLVGLNITYNADSTCDIKIKLRRRSGFNESKV